MGCSGSQPAQGVNANDSETIIFSKENSADGKADQLGSAKIAVLETTENLLQESNAAEENQLNLTSEPVNRPAREGDSLERTRTKRDGKEVENAWSVSKAKKNIEKVVTKPVHEELDDFESEFGKDGVDLTSSHVHGDQDNEKLTKNSLGIRTSPDGTHDVDYSDRMGKQRSIHKVNTAVINQQCFL